MSDVGLGVDANFVLAGVPNLELAVEVLLLDVYSLVGGAYVRRRLGLLSLQPRRHVLPEDERVERAWLEDA